MVFSKLFSTSRSRDKENERAHIIKGYPLTTSPVLPNILKHQVEFKKVMYGSTELIGFTFAPEGSDLVKSESLEFFRKKLLIWYPNNAKFHEKIKSEFSKNLIAISVSFFNFDVGESCHVFKLHSSVKPAGNGFLTYRKHSECIQYAYYNENNVEYMAGVTFYPAPHGTPKLLRSNNALLALASNSAISYPHGDRRYMWSETGDNQYGRFCSTAGKHVLLKCSKDDRVPHHYGYNHVTNKFEKSFCIECVKEFFAYEWEAPKKDTSATPLENATADAAVIHKKFVATPAAVTNSEASTVSRATSTESLLEGFERVDVNSDFCGLESDIDAELID